MDFKDEEVEILKDNMHLIKIRLVEGLEEYRKTMSYMLTDVPISILNLHKTTETVLVNAGCLRVYDLLDRDLTKIKGIGKRRVGDLTSCLNQFLSVC